MASEALTPLFRGGKLWAEGCGVYCVYGADAVQAVLCRPGGMHALRERQRLRLVAVGMTSCVQVACQQRRSLRSWELEERLHRLSYESPGRMMHLMMH
eukprot:6705788-Prymnesium_polylepis.1